MYIENPHQKRSASANRHSDPKRERKINDFLRKEPKEKLLESPEEMMISEHSRDVLTHWRAPEFEVYERDKRWYVYITLILATIIGWAIYTNSPVMAITFILIGVVGYVYINKEPRILDFMITKDGIVAGREIYEFDNLESFWIFYELPHTKILSLRTKSHMIRHVHIPIHEEDPVHIREIIMDYIPEQKQEEGLVETMERVLRI